MNSFTALLIAFCISWILFCGRVWWTMDRKNVWQRHTVAIAAGLGAGVFYFIGSFLIAASAAREKTQPVVPTSESVHIKPRP
jgi:hypothetical protein